MPSYAFHCECGKKSSEFLPMSQAEHRPTCDCGKKMERDFVAEFRGNQSFKPSCWPMLSDALGVHPDQISEAKEVSEKMGCPTDFTKDGRAILVSPAHRKHYAESHGFYDKNGSYGDPQSGKCRQ